MITLTDYAAVADVAHLIVEQPTLHPYDRIVLRRALTIGPGKWDVEIFQEVLRAAATWVGFGDYAEVAPNPAVLERLRRLCPRPNMPEVEERTTEFDGNAVTVAWSWADPDADLIQAAALRLPRVLAFGRSRLVVAPGKDLDAFLIEWAFPVQRSLRIALNKLRKTPWDVALGALGYCLVDGKPVLLTFQVVLAARAAGKSIDPAVWEALDAPPGETIRVRNLLAASSAASPEELPSDFLDQFNADDEGALDL